MSSGDHRYAAPLTPEQAARNRRIIRTIAIAFVLVSVFVFVWGMFVVQGTRNRAERSDEALRSAAWAVLCYAEQNHGSFPTSPQALAAARANEPVASGLGWPSTQAAALEGGAFVHVEEVAELVAVTWPPTGELPPVLDAKSGVSGFGTIELVNGWLKEYAHARRAPPAAPAPPPPAAPPSAAAPPPEAAVKAAAAPAPATTP